MHTCSERYSSTLSSPFHPTSSSPYSSSISCSPSRSSSTTLRTVGTLRTPPKRRWSLLMSPTSTEAGRRARTERGQDRVPWRQLPLLRWDLWPTSRQAAPSEGGGRWISCLYTGSSLRASWHRTTNPQWKRWRTRPGSPRLWRQWTYSRYGHEDSRPRRFARFGMEISDGQGVWQQEIRHAVPAHNPTRLLLWWVLERNTHGGPGITMPAKMITFRFFVLRAYLPNLYKLPTGILPWGRHFRVR